MRACGAGSTGKARVGIESMGGIGLMIGGSMEIVWKPAGPGSGSVNSTSHESASGTSITGMSQDA